MKIINTLVSDQQLQTYALWNALASIAMGATFMTTAELSLSYDVLLALYQKNVWGGLFLFHGITSMTSYLLELKHKVINLFISMYGVAIWTYTAGMFVVAHGFNPIVSIMPIFSIVILLKVITTSHSTTS